MQIFVTDICPYQSARNLDDKRVIKMATESAQILSTVMHLKGHGDIAPYKLTHQHHPCVKWAAENDSNYYWLCQHLEGLCLEYAERYPGKSHKCLNYLSLFKSVLTLNKINKPVDFCNCTEYTNYNTLMAYRLCLLDKWETDKRTPTWYGRAL